MYYDILVVGGGPAGCRAAELAASKGLKVALFEKDELGGVCLNYGCIPTKTLLYAARLYDHMKYEAAMFGITADHLNFNPAILWKRKDRTVERLRAALRHRLSKVGVNIIKAQVTRIFDCDSYIQVVAGREYYAGKNLIWATGGRPRIPDIDGIVSGLHSGIVVTPREILSRPVIPQSLIIIGGGCIGIEFAAFYQSVGSAVTIVEQTGKLGGDIEARLASFLLSNLQKRNVSCHFDSQVISIAGNRIILDNGTELKGDMVLLACGWEAVEFPNVDLSNNSHFFVVGDASGKMFLAPVAEFEAEAAVRKILGETSVIYHNSMIPRMIFANPEVAFWGKTLAAARLNDSAAYETFQPLTISSRYAIEHPQENGFLIRVFSGAHELIGLHIAGTGASELLTTFCLQQNSSIVLHPSLSEIWKYETGKIF